jgi:hypothetical protein
MSLFRLLLRLLPRARRAQYGEEMILVARDLAREAHAQGGPVAASVHLMRETEGS